MKTLLISYTTLVAFLALSVIGAVVMPVDNQIQAATKAKTNDVSCYKWNFENYSHATVLTSLNLPQTGSLNAAKFDISYRNNIKPAGDYVDPFKVLNTMVLDPYINTNTLDLRVNSGKVFVLNGGKHYRVSDTGNQRPHYTESGTFNRDVHDGGDMIFNFNNARITQVKFRSIDMGDELDGKGRINNNYFVVTTSDNKTEITKMGKADGSNNPDKYVADHSTKEYQNGIKSLRVHFSGSAAVDNLEVCNNVLPTNTPPTVPTTEPTKPPVTKPPVTSTPEPTTPPAVMECKDEKTMTFVMDEFNARFPNKRSFTKNVQLSQLGSLAKKYNVKVSSYWGWTGAENQKGSGNDKRVQNNENHQVTASLKYWGVIQSKTMLCQDLGNTLQWDDGSAPLLDNGPDYSHFLSCRKDIAFEKNNGVVNSQVTFTPDHLKYATVLEINSKLTDDVVKNYESCVAQYSARKCNASHYSKVTVTYCTKEGVK